VIKKGDIIAFSSDQEGFFHFQLRHNRNPVNPIIYLN
jgi:murein DD-endopeptidase MepM/ murein hydrolase activator NlpD